MASDWRWCLRLVRDKSPSVKAHKWGVSLLTPPKWRPNIFRSKSAARCEKAYKTLDVCKKHRPLWYKIGRMPWLAGIEVASHIRWKVSIHGRMRETITIQVQWSTAQAARQRSSQNNNFCTCQSPQRKLNDLLITATAKSNV